MEYEKIKQLMEDMGNSKLTSINIDFPDGTKISMKKEMPQVSVTNTSNILKPTNELVEEVKTTDTEEIIKEDINIIKSPMVGTFYLKPSPTSDPYVEVGSKIKKGQTVCIIEAMKLMNEIESDFDGEIAEIYVKDGMAVEYGTQLFGLK